MAEEKRARELIEELRNARTAWHEDFGVPVSATYGRFLEAIGELCDYADAESSKAKEGPPNMTEREAFDKWNQSRPEFATDPQRDHHTAQRWLGWQARAKEGPASYDDWCDADTAKALDVMATEGMISAEPMPSPVVILGTCETTDWPHLMSDGSGRKQPHEKRYSCRNWRLSDMAAKEGQTAPQIAKACQLLYSLISMGDLKAELSREDFAAVMQGHRAADNYLEELAEATTQAQEAQRRSDASDVSEL